MNVALTFNVKPESQTFPEEVPPKIKSAGVQPELSIDTYAEWDTWDTINAVKGALECYNNVTLVEADYSAFTKLKEINPDIVFNIAEGFNGVSREAQIPSILDMLQIPYTGSDPLTLATCLDKARAKEILSYYKIPNAKFVIADSMEAAQNIDLDFPLIVKPISEGSSKGIFSTSFVRDKNELLKEIERVLGEYNQPALVEEFLQGREFTVAILGNGDEAEVLPIVEISYSEFPKDFVPIYSYEAKWILDTKENPLDVFSCPAKVDARLEKKISEVALKTYNILRCKDWSRIDVRLDKNNEPNIIEINPLPGILPNPEENSCFPKAARTKGLNYNEMINKVLYVAAKRYNLI
ncbi:MAG: ATP-grasp domain-containing protein [Ignavibacteriaceae bacterium]|nr:ATP-grasp domain-containing protein [Ignavibacteriaceae bacterium]